MKRRIRLTEGDLHRIVRDSVTNVIQEAGGFEIPPIETWAPHSRKMTIMFDKLNNILDEIAKYAVEQGIYSYSVPAHQHTKASYHSEIKDTIDNMKQEAHELQNKWGKHLYRIDKDYKNRPEFQLPRR